jgi:membrane-associated phospholipid phosphatase
MKISKFISYIFHPINFSIIGALLYFLLVPKYIFKPVEHTILIVLFSGTYVFPIFLLYLMKKFEMIQSFEMTSIEERKFPTVLFISITIFIGYWLYKTTIVNLLALFYLGYGICLIGIYLFLYFNRKISLHMAGIGGLIGFLIYFSYHFKINLLWLFMLLFVISGLIATARIKLKAHTPTEVLIGYFLGIFSQFIVYLSYITIYRI